MKLKIYNFRDPEFARLCGIDPYEIDFAGNESTETVIADDDEVNNNLNNGKEKKQ